MLETLKLSQTLKSSRDDFNGLDNFNVSSIKNGQLLSRRRRGNPRRTDSLVNNFKETHCLANQKTKQNKTKQKNGSSLKQK